MSNIPPYGLHGHPTPLGALYPSLRASSPTPIIYPNARVLPNTLSPMMIQPSRALHFNSPHHHSPKSVFHAAYLEKPTRLVVEHTPIVATVEQTSPPISTLSTSTGEQKPVCEGNDSPALDLFEDTFEIPKGFPSVDGGLLDRLSQDMRMAFVAESVKGRLDIISKSPRFSTTGLNSFQIVGKCCKILKRPVSDEDVIRYLCRKASVSNFDKVFLKYEIDGETSWNWIQIHVLGPSDEGTHKYIAILVDVTEKESSGVEKQSEDPSKSVSFNIPPVVNQGTDHPSPREITPPKDIDTKETDIRTRPRRFSIKVNDLSSDSKDGKNEADQVSHGIRIDFIDLEYIVKVGVPQGPLEVLSKTARSLFSDISQEKSNYKMKTILHGISGSMKPGNMTAIMGPSGSGKTSLLSILGNRSRSGEIKGRLLYNMKPRTKQIKRHIGFVSQDDILFGDLTVRETLTITALLRLPNTMLNGDKHKRVDEVMRTLGLMKCAESQIGSAARRGVSGGERKRVNVGNELIINPNVVILDEPTSGLDSSTAYLLLVTLQKLAREGKTIVLSIHQPSSQMFSLLDNLLLLADGHVMYQMPTSSSIEYFDQMGFVCPLGFNMSDFIMELLTKDGDEDNQIQKKLILEVYKKKVHPDVIKDIETHLSGNSSTPKSPLSVLRKNDKQLSPLKQIVSMADFFSENSSHGDAAESREITSKNRDDDDVAQWPTNFWQQYVVLCSRSFKLKRGQTVRSLLLWQYLSMSLIIGTVWFDVGTHEDNIRDRAGALFFVTVYFSYQALFSALNAFPAEKHILLKERASGSYRLSAYYLAKCTAEIPFELMWPTFGICIIYWMVNFNPDPAKFFTFWICLLINTLTAQSLGLAISAGVPELPKASVVATTLILASMLVSGFYAKIDLMPQGIREFRYLTFFRYAYAAFLKTDISGDIEFQCAGTSPEDSNYSSCADSRIIDHQDILDDYEIDMEVGDYIGIMLLFTFIMRTVAYFVLKSSSKA